MVSVENEISDFEAFCHFGKENYCQYILQTIQKVSLFYQSLCLLMFRVMDGIIQIMQFSTWWFIFRIQSSDAISFLIEMIRAWPVRSVTLRK